MRNHVKETLGRGGVAPGIAFGRDLEHRNELIEQGFRFIGVGGDKDFLRTVCSEVLAKISR